MMRITVLCLGLLAGLAGSLSTATAASQQGETVCIQCHGGLSGALGAPVKDWRGSIHASNGISCNDCHGGDPTDFAMAMSPDRGFLGAPDYEKVPEFCGRCHVGVLKDYLQSAHGMALSRGGAQCVVCHTNHSVQKASLDLINRESCTRCHDYARAEKVKAALADTDGKISAMETELDHLAKLGMFVDEYKGEVFSLRNRFHRVFHTVNIERIKAQTGPILAGLDKVREQVAKVDARLGQRRLWGGIAIGLLVLAGVLFLLVRKTYEEEEKG